MLLSTCICTKASLIIGGESLVTCSHHTGEKKKGGNLYWSYLILYRPGLNSDLGVDNYDCRSTDSTAEKFFIVREARRSKQSLCVVTDVADGGESTIAFIPYQ